MGLAGSPFASTPATDLSHWMGFASNRGSNLYETSRANPGVPEASQDGGHLVALPTKAEVQARLQTVKAFVATIPTRSASNILKY